MDINSIIESTRDLLRQGETGKALQTLLGFLEKDPRYADAARTLQVVEANYNAARQQEIKGILSFQDAQRQYSQVNDALLSSLDALAAGRAPRVMSAQKNSYVPWVIGGVAVLLLGLLLGLWLTRRGSDKPAQAQVDAEVTCPKFDPKDFKIMLLPFQNLGNEVARPELAIQTRIRDLTGRNSLNADIEVLADKRFEDNTPDIDAAAALGKQCEADLVIWGQYDRSKDSINVDVRYVFTKGAIRSGIVGSRVLNSVAAIKSGRMLRDLDDAILSLCGLVALHNGKPDLAVKWMEKIKKPNEGDKKVMEKLDELMERGGGMKKQKSDI